MSQNEHSRFVDDLLDASLAQYRSVEPRPGLENRILARLRTEQATSPPGWAWRMGAGLIGAGAILALVSIAHRGRLELPISPAGSHGPAPRVEASRNTATVPLAQSLTRRHKHSGIEQSAELQRGSADLVSKSAAVSRSVKTAEGRQQRRLDVFPSPAPLSQEERLLVNLVRQSPDGAWVALPDQGEAGANSRVPDQNIRPLEMKDLSDDAMDGTR